MKINHVYFSVCSIYIWVYQCWAYNISPLGLILFPWVSQMRVIIQVINSTRRSGDGWAGHMAICVLPQAYLRHIQGTLQEPLNASQGRDCSTSFIAMEYA